MDKDKALRLALEALENNRRTHHYCEDTWYSCPKHEDGCANDSEGDECNCGADKANAGIDKAITAIKAALEAKDEPVAFASHGVINWIADKQFQHEADLYVTPPQRTWVGLTDEELSDIYNQTDWDIHTNWDYERAIGAKLKEKNNTTLAEQTGEESSILFSLNDGKEVMRIDKNGVTANPEIRVDEAGAHVISALDVHIKNLIKAERDACAKTADEHMQESEGKSFGVGNAIRARVQA